MRRLFVRYAALYALVELAVFALLVWGVGLGWALVVVAATFAVGVLLAASQLKGQVAAVRRARRNPHGAVTDGVLVGFGSALVLLPGVVSTAVGSLMLAPPTRSVMRPLATTMLTRGVARRVGAVNVDQFLGPIIGPQPGRGDYIDGEVIDDSEQSHRPRPRTPNARGGDL
jgi:UPF0716 protein FxsA